MSKQTRQFIKYVLCPLVVLVGIFGMSENAVNATPALQSNPPARKPISDGTLSPQVSTGVQVTEYQGKAYFTSSNAIWRTDGTEAGTEVFYVAEAEMSNIYLLHVQNDLLYFYVRTDSQREALWVTNGSTEGTTELIASETGQFRLWHTFGPWLYFAEYGDAQNDYYFKLYRTAGTPETVEVVEVPGITDRTDTTFIDGYPFAETATASFFWLSTDQSKGLWREDADGPREVKSFSYPSGAGIATSPSVVKGETIYFLAQTGDGAGGIWRSDGTEAGTLSILPLRVAFNSPIKDTFDGELFIQLDDSVILFEQGEEALILHRFLLDSEELTGFKTITSTDGRVLPTSTFTTQRVGNQLVFAVHVDWRAEFWRSDGTADGTVPLGGPTPYSPYDMAVHERGLAFLSGNTELYWLEFAKGQILRLQDLGRYLFLVPTLSQTNNFIYYTADAPGGGSETMWQLDPEFLSISSQYLPAVAAENERTISE